MTTSPVHPAFGVPELGPSLGRLVAPAPPPSGSPAPWAAVDDLRIAFVTQLFELAGDARRWVREADRELAFATLSRDGWAAAWHATVEAVATRAVEAINARLAAAAREACLPDRRARRLGVDADEHRGLVARLGAGTPPLRHALDDLERAAHLARGERVPADASRQWQEAVLTAARRQEAAWLALESALTAEWRLWEAEAQAVRAWRRPRWPLVLIGGALFGIAGWVGLMLGGYLPVPAPLLPAAEWVWARWN